MNACARAGRRLRPDAPSVRFHDRARDREAEPAAAVIAVTGLVDAVEAVEDPLEAIGRDPGTGVGDAELDPVAVDRPRDRDPVPSARVVDGVLREVAKHLR